MRVCHSQVLGFGRPGYRRKVGFGVDAASGVLHDVGAWRYENARDRLAETEYMVSGARCGRRCGLMLVAHTKRPRVCSSPLREAFWVARSSCSWACSFASFMLGEADRVDVWVDLPSAPEDAVAEMDLAPGHGREDGLEENGEENELLRRGRPV